jgi:hypothetical protein
MADGTIRNSIENIVIPVNKDTKRYYNLLKKTLIKERKII